MVKARRNLQQALTAQNHPLRRGHPLKSAVALAAATRTAQQAANAARKVVGAAKSALDKSGPAPSGVPVSFPVRAEANAYSESNKTTRSTRVRGASTYAVVQTTGTSSGNVVIPFSVHPLAFNDRFSTHASTYDKYVYHSIRAVYTPTCPTTTTGSVAMYFDRDPDDPPAPAAVMKNIMSMERATLGSVWSKAETRLLRDPSEKKTYFTNCTTLESRDYEQFKLYVYLLGVPTSAQSYGYITIHYDCELISPVLAPKESAAGVSLAFLGPTVGNAEYLPLVNATSSIPYGVPASIDFTGGQIIEVILSDTLTAATNSGFTIGTNGVSVSSFRAGQPFYITQGGAGTAVDSANYLVYLSFQDAVERSGRHLRNSTAGTRFVFNNNVAVYYRVVGSTQSSQLVV